MTIAPGRGMLRLLARVAIAPQEHAIWLSWS